MLDASEFRQRASEFIRRAAEADDVSRRISLLEWASAWNRMANLAEAAEAAKPKAEQAA